jgi:hypothetical protein
MHYSGRRAAGVKILSDYVSQTPFLELQGMFKDAILATDWLRLIAQT